MPVHSNEGCCTITRLLLFMRASRITISTCTMNGHNSRNQISSFSRARPHTHRKPSTLIRHFSNPSHAPRPIGEKNKPKGPAAKDEGCSKLTVTDSMPVQVGLGPSRQVLMHGPGDLAALQAARRVRRHDPCGVVREIHKIGMRIEQNNLENYPMKMNKHAERKSRDPYAH